MGMPEWLAVLIGVAAIAVPAILAVMGRDRSLMKMIADGKETSTALIKAATDPLHERVGRIRDEYLRRDDFFGHMARLEKAVDDTRDMVQRGQDQTEKKLDDIHHMLRDMGKPPGAL